ncbi:MAG TPA: L,D-transpeptidase [Verrucomicrobiae bacterium]|nr:L,D-transpeptidase [Verrucomicrobiae bacterium]
MLTVTVFLAGAMLCFDGKCYPVLVGEDTPTGTYPLTYMHTEAPNYGGEVLLFKETAEAFFAVHRTWPGREGLYERPPGDRRRVTNGCINLPPAIFSKLQTAVYTAGGAMLQIKAGRPGALANRRRSPVALRIARMHSSYRR